MTKMSTRIALLIDCDNVSHNAVERVLEELAKYGTVNIRHAHGDWKSPHLSGWVEKLHPNAIKPMQQFAYTTESFNVSLHKAAEDAPVVLFAVGAGGLPERHSTLLNALVESGCTVVAPHSGRLASRIPEERELILRARRLSLALDVFVSSKAKAIGVGHSIGATTLLALAGAQMWLAPGQRVYIAPDHRFTRLVLMAPPTGFFQAPGALDTVRVPMLIWVGSEDQITPPAQSQWLAHALCDKQPIDLRVTEGAGHFSFMDHPPPNTTEPLPDKQAFLREHSNAICRFVFSHSA